MVTISARMTADEADALEKLARRMGVSMTEYFRQAIREKLDRDGAHDPA